MVPVTLSMLVRILKQEAELEQLKAALQTLGVETEEKEETANAK